MSYIDKQATIDAIYEKANEELADANHHFLAGVHMATAVVMGMPSAQPDEEKISDALYNIYRNTSPHTSAEGVAAVKYCIREIYREIFGKEKPGWMR